MNIERVEQFLVVMPLKHPFETSFGREETVAKVITAVYSGGLVGFGEAPTSEEPWYLSETAETCWYVQHDYLIPALLGAQIENGADAPRLFSRVRGHAMAKAGLEAALWDLAGRAQGRSVAEMIGAPRERVEVGVSIGIQETPAALLELIEAYIEQGYPRIKIKIKPGWDEAIIRAVRQRFPAVRLMADANSAYTLADADMLRALDGYGLLMIEQPLAYDDILDHAALQAQLSTPICLDESITTLARARDALALRSCRIINIKPARVGGISAAMAVHDLCMAQGVPVWCGGLLESGIGRAANLAVAALPNFTLPGDISATDRYWHEDIVEEVFTLNPDGTIDVPRGPGLGVEVNRARLERVTRRRALHT